MKKTLKLLSTLLLIGYLISSTSVQVFANTEKNMINTKQGSNPIYSGKIKDMPNDLYDSIKRDKPTFRKINLNTNVKIINGYKTYTYATAPKSIRKEHEENCKAINEIPNPLDSISIPYTINNVSSKVVTKAAPFILIGNGTDSKGDFIFVTDLNGVNHRAHIYSDYVGYNRTTKGDPVIVAQYLLNEYGYNISVDGIFGPKTHSALESFQRSHNLSVDCIIGPKTWKSLYN